MKPRAPVTYGIGRLPAFAFAILFHLILAATPSRAQEDSGEAAEKTGAEIAGKAGPAAPAIIRSIPYPGGALYVPKGISGAFMGGKHRNLGEVQSLFQWQGELSYFYTPWLSGGFGFKITAGEPNSSQQKIFNRYFAHLRFHKEFPSIALYAGPQIGVGNLNLLTDSTADALRNPGKDPVKDGPIGNTKPTFGLELGGGWMFSRYVGFTLGNHLEYSLVDEEGVGVSNALNLHINPGLAVDIMAFSNGLRKVVSAMYVSLEVQSGFLIFEKTNKRQDRAGVLGLGLAF